MHIRTHSIAALLTLPLLFSCRGTEAPGSQLPPLEAPSDVVVVINTEGKAIVTWKDNSSEESGFSIWTKTSFRGLSDKIAEVGPDETACDISSLLKVGTSYYVGVAAEGTEGVTSSSEVKYSTIFSYVEVTPTPGPAPTPDPEPDPEPGTPSVSFVGDPVCTNASIRVEYALRNIPKRSVTYGLTWNEEGGALADDPVSTPGGTDRRGYETVVQAIHAACLEQGKTYKMRAWVKASGEVYYSDEIEVALGPALDPIVFNWTDTTPSGFPAEVKTYMTTTTLNGDKLNAWYAVADLSTGKVQGRLNLEQGKLRTLEDQYKIDSSKPLVLINGGYFYGSNAVGLAIVGSSAVSTLYTVRGTLRSDSSYAISAEYDDMYNVTRGCFGFDSSGKPSVYWSHGTSYYSSPLPQIVGEAMYQAPNSLMPHSKVSWNPKYAVGAGPVLVKDGKVVVGLELTGRGDEYFLNNFELIPYDIFNIGESPDRTAAGITEDGKIVFFICDGRIPSSDGADIVELARIMLGLGCVDAVNLDGGGSTAMLVGGERVNSTEANMSGAAENRPVATNLGFYLK